MKMLTRAIYLMITLLFVCSNGHADEKIFFNTFMVVCSRNIDNFESIYDMVNHFHYKELPREFWPASENYKAWIYHVEKDKYLLSVDNVNGSNICALEAMGVNDVDIRLLLKGFFDQKGKLELAKTIPENKTYLWQELYKGYDKELGIDCFFAIKKREKSVTLVAMKPIKNN